MNPKKDSSRPVYFKLIVILCAILVTILAGEIFSRFALKLSPESSLDQNPWMEVRPEGLRLIPNTHIKYQARINGRVIGININSMGFRGPELSSTLDPGRPRVLFLGDSILFGPGLDYNETITSRLSQNFRHRVEFINAGVPGMSIKDEVDFFEEKVEPLKPDLVLLGYYLNDPVRSIVLTEEYGDLKDFWTRNIVAIRRRSALANRIWEGITAARLIKTHKMNAGWVQMFHDRKWVTDRAVYDKIIELAADDFGAGWDEKSWVTVETQLTRLKALCLEREIPVAVIIFPVSLQIESHAADDDPQKRIIQIANKNQLPVFDLLPSLRAGPTELLLYDQCHYTPKGAEFVAYEISKWLSQEQALVP